MNDVERPILMYYGSKWRDAPWVLGFIEHLEHTTYVEPCGGSAAVLLQKEPVQYEVYNDLDERVVGFFRTLRESPDELRRLIDLTPWSRVEYEASLVADARGLEAARRFFITSWLSIAGVPHGDRGIRSYKTAEQRRVTIERSMRQAAYEVSRVAARMQRVFLESRDAVSVIRRHNGPAVLIYFDPPYDQRLRTRQRGYHHEVDPAWHERAAVALREHEGFVLVSGYASADYRRIYEDWGWVRYNRPVQTNGGGTAVESLWLNPRAAQAYERGLAQRRADELPPLLKRMGWA